MSRAPQHPESTESLATLAQWVALAIDHHHKGRLKEAVSCYRRIVSIRPDWADAYNNLGSVLEADGMLDEAKESYQQATRLDPQNALAHHNLGCLLNRMGDLEAAASHYQTAIILRPDYAQAHSNLGNLFLVRGDLEKAEAKYQLALSIAPNDAATHNNLGNVWKARHKLERAGQCYIRAISLKSDYAEAHNNLGCVLLDQGKVDPAIACFERALELNRNYAEAHCNLGVAFQDLGRLDEAILCFERAIVIRPDYPEAWNNWGGAQKDQGALADAQSHCERALSLAPDFAAAYCNLGSILQDQGRFKEAAIEFRKALTINPIHPEAHYNLSLVKTFKADDSDLAALKTLAGKSETFPRTKQPFIYFALAKALEDIGDYSESFDHLLTGNRLKREMTGYNEAKALDYLRKIARVFDYNLINRCQGLGDPTPTPVFILGMPRSGSSLVEQILASHPQVHGAGELTLLSRVVNTPPYSYLATSSRLDAAALRELGANYLSGLPTVPSGTSRITDKMPGNFLYVGLIHLMFPNARIIHTIRNPADTCLSCFSKLFSSGTAYSYDLAELGRYYRAYSQLMDHWKFVLPKAAMLDVHYEEVVNNLETQARRLIDYCGLDWDPACIRFHENKRPVLTASNVRVRQPVFNSSVNRYQRYEHYLQPLLFELNRK